MGTHLAAWTESINSATLTPVDAVVDDILNRPTPERFFVPPSRNFVHWAAAVGADITRAQLQSPSIGVRRSSLEIVPRERGAAAFTLNYIPVFKPEPAYRLDPSEHVEFQAAEDNAAASRVYGLVCLGPQNLPAVPSGEVVVVRATGTTTLTANAWTTVTVTEDNTLPAGLYALIGFIPVSATAIAARALIPEQTWRPGMPAVAGTEAAAVDSNIANLRGLMNYEMGRFDHNNIPQFQFLASAADTAETVFMYLVKVG